MDVLLVLLILISLVAMVAGLIKPSLVIRWGEKKTRPRVLMVYSGLFIVFFMAFVMTMESNNKGNNNKPVVKTDAPQKVEQAKTDEKKDSAAGATPSNEPEVKYNNKQARMHVGDWLFEHQFPNNPKLSVSEGAGDSNFYESNGKKYHLFTVFGLPRNIDILVDPYTGELSFHDINIIKPIDKWYSEYRKSHDSYSQNRIDENFEWVEKPSVYNGAIIGKVKNISNKEFVSCTIEFNLYDANKNQLSSLAVGQIRNLKAGNVWSFSVPIIFNNVASYEFKSVKGYTW